MLYRLTVGDRRGAVHRIEVSQTIRPGGVVQAIQHDRIGAVCRQRLAVERHVVIAVLGIGPGELRAVGAEQRQAQLPAARRGAVVHIHRHLLTGLALEGVTILSC